MDRMQQWNRPRRRQCRQCGRWFTAPTAGHFFCATVCRDAYEVEVNGG